MPSVQELAAKLNQETSDNLKRFVLAMPEEKYTWKPLDEGRSAHDQIVECGIINGFAAQILNSRAMPPMEESFGNFFARMLAENDTREKALALLQKGTDSLLAAIQAFSPDNLDETITLPFGGGMVRSFAEIMLMGQWNMNYHQGQIAYIQTLYGDREMH